MKKIFLSLGLIILIFTLGACSKTIETGNDMDLNLNDENVASSSQALEESNIVIGKYTVNTDLSKINWKGEKVIGSSHEGKLKIKSGEFYMSDNKIVSGEIIFDMDTITDNDNNQKLVDHLKNDDFFSTETYPESKLTIKDSTLESLNDNKAVYNILASLEIKGIEEEINFNATLEFKGSYLNIYSEQEIDRTRWDIRYGSDKFFDNLEDNIIKDEIELEIILVSSLSE
jgi:polyisoprenoid-binding protein YceI